MKLGMLHTSASDARSSGTRSGNSGVQGKKIVISFGAAGPTWTRNLPISLSSPTLILGKPGGNLVLQEIEDETELLTEQMARRRWPRVIFGSFCGAAAPALAIADPLLTGGNALSVGLAVGAGLLGAAAVADQNRAQRIVQRFDRHSPLAYAALVGRQFNSRAQR
jgi:hypothetical protein